MTTSSAPPQTPTSPGPADTNIGWLETAQHREWLAGDARRQFDFFRASVKADGGFYVLDGNGEPLKQSAQELHTTTRLVHSFALGKLARLPDCDRVIDHGLHYLWNNHRDDAFGGYFWSLDDAGVKDNRKLCYGHVFVLLAGSSAHMAGHPDAARLIEDASGVLDARFWDEEFGLFCDEWNRDWTPFSSYRGMNANMHGVEALLAAFEATGREIHLERAGRILDFFFNRIIPDHGWRLPEHYDDTWRVDSTYAGDPIFRPPGTTPGHSFEMARLLLQYWDLVARPEDGTPALARKVVERALADAWDNTRGGLAYTLDFDGVPANTSRFWWPVTEAIGVMAALLKLDNNPQDEIWYRKLWTFADTHFIDGKLGGWYPEIDDEGAVSSEQFAGKPDIYHALQAELFPLAPGLSRFATTLPALA